MQTWIHKAKNRELSWELHHNSSLFQSKLLLIFPGDVVGISSLFKIITGTVKLSQAKQNFTHFAFPQPTFECNRESLLVWSGTLFPCQRTWGPKMSSHWSLHLKGNCVTRPICLYRKTCSSQISALLLCFFEWLYIRENWKHSSSPHGSFGLPTTTASLVPVCSLSFWCRVPVVRRPEICTLEVGVRGEVYTYRQHVRFRGRV